MSQILPNLRLVDPDREPLVSPARPPQLSKPHRPATAQEQIQAMRTVQQQVEQRVQIGAKLFKAAQVQSIKHQTELEQIKAEQQQLRQQMRDDLTSSLNNYDKWISKIDHNVEEKLQALELRLQNLQQSWGKIEKRVESILLHAEDILDSSKQKLADQPQPDPTNLPADQSLSTDNMPNAPTLHVVAQDPVPRDNNTLGEPSPEPIFSKILSTLRDKQQNELLLDTDASST